MRRYLIHVLIVSIFVAGCSPEAEPRTVASTEPALPTTTTTMAPSAAAAPPSTESTVTTTAAATTTTLAPADTTLALEVVAEGLDQPVFFTENDDRDYIVDQEGRIWSLATGEDPAVALDIRDRVEFGGERGLLGLAFHPEHPDLLYVDYTRAGDGATVVSEFTASGDPLIFDAASERVILVIPQPAGNHNGGMIAFGPRGDLWIGMGDGGGSNDTYGNGQSADTLLGALLRVRVGPELEPYGLVEPQDFISPEIWAIGLRNPWRFSFDGDQIWIGDVGQNDVEEINRESIEAVGLNFGWPVYEGTACFAGPCDADGLVDGSPAVSPVHEYRHDEGCSVTGGYVYRGDGIPQLDGHYFFSDWCSGFIRSIAPDGSVHDWTDGTGAVAQVVSFGRDEAGEVYVVSAAGTIYRIVEGRQ